MQRSGIKSLQHNKTCLKKEENIVTRNAGMIFDIRHFVNVLSSRQNTTKFPHTITKIESQILNTIDKWTDTGHVRIPWQID